MPVSNALKELYENRLKNHLAAMENSRKNLLRQNIAGFGGVGLSFAAFIIIGVVFSEAHLAYFILPVLVLFFSSVYLGNTAKKQKIYRRNYKTNIVGEIVKFVDPTLHYAPDLCINKADYGNSDLFRIPYDKYEGEDLVSGVIQKTDFSCSELHTQYKKVTTNSEGKKREEWVTIFRGLFFHADFNKNFKGRTYVSPDSLEKIFGKFGQRLQQIGGKAELVQLENPEFEKEFVVYSSDQVEARYILTPQIMEAMLRIRWIVARPVHFSFTGSRVYCAIDFDSNLFEPGIIKSGLRFSDIEKIHRLVELNKTIINELNLNLRIWTKK